MGFIVIVVDVSDIFGFLWLGCEGQGGGALHNRKHRGGEEGGRGREGVCVGGRGGS